MRTGRHGIDTPLVPGMALGQSAQGETAAFYSTMCGNSFPRVGGAVGVKATVIAQKGTQADLVTGDKKDQ